MDCKNQLTSILNETRLTLQDFYKVNKLQSKRQKLSKKGILKVYQIFKNKKENEKRRNKINIQDYDGFQNINIFGLIESIGI